MTTTRQPFGSMPLIIFCVNQSNHALLFPCHLKARLKPLLSASSTVQASFLTFIPQRVPYLPCEPSVDPVYLASDGLRVVVPWESLFLPCEIGALPPYWTDLKPYLVVKLEALGVHYAAAYFVQVFRKALHEALNTQTCRDESILALQVWKIFLYALDLAFHFLDFPFRHVDHVAHFRTVMYSFFHYYCFYDMQRKRKFRYVGISCEVFRHMEVFASAYRPRHLHQLRTVFRIAAHVFALPHGQEWRERRGKGAPLCFPDLG